MTISTSRSTKALAARRALAVLLLVGICPLFTGIPRLAADGPAGDDPLGFEETVSTFLVAVAVLPTPEVSLTRTVRPPCLVSRRSDSPSPLSLRAPPGV